jgi:type II secretory pathway component PulF
MPPYLLFFLWQLKKSANVQLPDWLGSFFLSIPLVGSIVRKTDYARFYRAYGISLEAGIPAPNAVTLSAGACGNPVLRDIFLNTASKMAEDRCSFCEAYADYIYEADIDSPEISMMESGEISGKADEAAKHLANMYQGESEEAVRRLAKIVPKLIYIAIVIYMAISIVNFFAVLLKKTTAL